MRAEKRDQQHLAPPVPLHDTTWSHALEIRYLVGPDANRPPPIKANKKEEICLVDVPDNALLLLNVLLGASRRCVDVPAPFANAKHLWHVTHSDGRSVLLVGRVVRVDEENRNHLNRLRGPDGPKFTLASGDSPAYFELMDFHWSTEGSNVILVVPTGEEAIRQLEVPAVAAIERTPTIEISCPDASLDFVAPNGATVAKLRVEGTSHAVQLRKNEHVATTFGNVHLTIYANNLLKGESFETGISTLECVPRVAGAHPPRWVYCISCAFHDTELTATIRTQSAGVRVGADDAARYGLLQLEEIVLVAPVSELELRACFSQPQAKAPLAATVLLCDIIHR
jgi:hypothetical protein